MRADSSILHTNREREGAKRTFVSIAGEWRSRGGEISAGARARRRIRIRATDRGVNRGGRRSG